MAIKVRIDSVEPRDDGSGMVALDCWALDNVNAPIPGMHRTVLLSAADVAVAMAKAPAARGPALVALVQAAIAEFASAALLARMAANAAAATQSTALNTTYTFPLSITI